MKEGEKEERRRILFLPRPATSHSHLLPSLPLPLLLSPRIPLTPPTSPPPSPYMLTPPPLVQAHHQHPALAHGQGGPEGHPRGQGVPNPPGYSQLS